ncbi:MAG TPA: DNA primase [Patescibacteria group bacterium]
MDQVSEIRDKIDIVGLIQEYITLKKAGRNFKANCPFHGEKTPSFVISPERQIWHCFGCGKGGDVFTFMMEYEHIEFAEALRILADKAGVVLKNRNIDSGLSSKKEKIYALNHLASEFYHFLLTKHELGKNALEYLLNERKIKPQTINTYMLGFSPRGSALVTYLQKKKHYTREDILDAGLGSPRGHDMVDFFQGRLIFPLYDHRDNIIGFSGRVLNNSDKTSKYINTRETLVYHKGLTFFGLNSAKKSIKEKDWAIIMEGEFDVISSFEEGITNTVAVKGTALTPDQAALLSRFGRKVSLCFDSDAAGQEALKRSVPILEKKNLQVSVIVMEGGKDPDEILKNSPGQFKKALKEDVPVYDYLLSKETEKYPKPLSPFSKQKIGDDLLPLFGGIENEIVKEHYLQLLSKTLDTSIVALQKALDKLSKREVVKREVVSVKEQKSREERLETYLLALVLQSNSPKDIFSEIDNFIKDYTWQNISFQKVILHLQKYVESHPEALGKDGLIALPEELTPSFDECFLLPLPQFENEVKWIDEAKKTAEELYILFIKEQIKRLGETIKEKEKDGSSEELAKLQAEFSHFVSLLGKK